MWPVQVVLVSDRSHALRGNAPQIAPRHRRKEGGEPRISRRCRHNAAVAESVQYQGRKASRRGSEQRRQDILDAAMRIVVRDGVRAVRHRAVAAEAGVPLSATTYYFKDIDDLLTDTFAQYVERSAAFKVLGQRRPVTRDGRLWRRQPGVALATGR